MPNCTRIGVNPSSYYAGHAQLFEALACVFDVRFEPAQDPGDPQWDAVIINGRAVTSAPQDKPSFVLAPGDALPCANAPVKFGFSTSVPNTFRGAHLNDPSLQSVVRLAIDGSSEVLAHCGGYPIWLRVRERPETHVSALELPKMEGGDAHKPVLWDHFQLKKWAALLFLLHWLKKLARADWLLPEARALIIVDDPNLQATSYGYLNYEELVADARRNNYHAAIATIPLDSWHTNRKAVEVFRRNTDRLSLAIHGNNHTRAELARTQDRHAAFAIVSQALRRIASFERRTGLEVSRVMVAPHGACNTTTGAAMLTAGFESACISIGSLAYWNPDVKWTPALGLWMAHPLGGLPVFHRVGLVEIALQARIMLFLGQAAVFATHHADFDTFRTIANTVNSVGSVRWLSATEISRSNYHRRETRTGLEIEAFGRIITVPVGPSLESITIRVPWIGECHCQADWQGSLGRRTSARDTNIRIDLTSEADADFAEMSTGKNPSILTPLARRLMCQMRDRMMPLVHQ
jgi:hypothetical protein